MSDTSGNWHSAPKMKINFGGRWSAVGGLFTGGKLMYDWLQAFIADAKQYLRWKMWRDTLQ
jgi:hypothetical protein